MTKSPDLVIVGQATIDDIYREEDHASFLGMPGGDAIYSAIGASVWPLDLGVVTIVGIDYPHQKLSQTTCSENRTDWSGVKGYDGPSIHDKAIYHVDGSRDYEFDHPELIFELSPTADDIPVHMRNVNDVHIAPAKTICQLDVLRFYKRKGAVVSLDVETHFIKQDLASLEKSLALDPIFIPSLEHVQILSGVSSKNIRDHWDWIKKSGVSIMVIKCGSDGAVIVDVKQKKHSHIGIVKDLDIVDVTGAGDAFCGGFMAGYIKERDTFKASAYGAVSASFIVESIGAVKPHTYTRQKAMERLEKVLQTNPEKFERF